MTVRWERPTSTGTAYAILRWRDPETGRRRSRALGYVPSVEAERARGDLEAAIRLGLATGSTAPSPTVADVLREYVVRLDADHVGGDRYREQERAFAVTLAADLGTLRCDRLTDLDLRAYALRRAATPGRRRGTTLSVATLRHELETLRRAWTVAYKVGRLARPCPPLPGRVLPDNRRPGRWLSEPEVAAVLRAASAWHPTAGRLLTVLAWLPARPREVLGLTRDDCARVLDLALPREERLVRFRATKGGEGRGWRPVTQPALVALVEHLAEPSPSPWAWPSSDPDRPLPYATLYDWLRRAARAAGVADVLPYDLRKFGAGRILRATGSPADVCRYTGHRDVATFLRWYAQGAAGEAEAAAESIGWTPAPLRAVEAE